jgi:hypothetical protein
MNEFRPITQSWSDRYDIVQNARVRTNSGEEALMDPEMFDSLKRLFGEPLVGLVEAITTTSSRAESCRSVLSPFQRPARRT